VRVASFNILHGRSTVDGVVDPARLADAVRSLDADVLGLQEVDRAQPRSLRLDLTDVAAEAMGAVDARFVPALVGTAGEAWRPARGDEDPSVPAYGIALLSRLPVRSWVTVRLPALPLPRLHDEPRVAVGADLGDVTVLTTHLSFLPPWNRVQLCRLLLALRRVPGAQLLTGDLNIRGRLPVLLRGWTQLVDEPTFPAPVPRVQLDHVLARGFSATLRAASVVEMPLSDHRAVVVDLDPAPARKPPR
jgi:endonuclease/exonuclease/phosphatase family metal-dependent hydrolase